LCSISLKRVSSQAARILFSDRTSPTSSRRDHWRHDDRETIPPARAEFPVYGTTAGPRALDRDHFGAERQRRSVGDLGASHESFARRTNAKIDNLIHAHGGRNEGERWPPGLLKAVARLRPSNDFSRAPNQFLNEIPGRKRRNAGPRIFSAELKIFPHCRSRKGSASSFFRFGDETQCRPPLNFASISNRLAIRAHRPVPLLDSNQRPTAFSGAARRFARARRKKTVRKQSCSVEFYDRRRREVVDPCNRDISGLRTRICRDPNENESGLVCPESQGFFAILTGCRLVLRNRFRNSFEDAAVPAGSSWPDYVSRVCNRFMGSLGLEGELLTAMPRAELSSRSVRCSISITA